MLQFHKSKHKAAIILFTVMFAGTAGHTQNKSPIENARPQPVWWLGASGAANFNSYRGTTQTINSSFSTPTAFHKGKGIKPYVSVLAEYRPNKVIGGMLNIAFDNRGGKFATVMAPCNCEADLSTNISYIAVEPSLRIAPFSSKFYLFAGPTLNFNVSKDFTYTQELQKERKAEWGNIRRTAVSAQAGAGIDIPVSSRTSRTQTTLSPFVSFLTDIGHEPRSEESWSFYTVRAGVAIKFGKSKKATKPVAQPAPTPAQVEQEVQFSIRAPKAVPVERKVKESFPLRSSVFFDQGSTTIPARYVVLNNTQAKAFKEEQLQVSQPANLNNGRSSRQLVVYHNILNIVGDRLRSNPGTTITLTGASDKNPAEGKMLAENIKQYLVNTFGINGSRISTEGRDKPLLPSQQPGATKELALLREGDRRVDISSSSPELLLQVGGSPAQILKPVYIKEVQADLLDSQVMFNVIGASELLNSWNIEITDDKGSVQRYGPFTKDQASVSGKTILGNSTGGNYKFVMLGKTKTGRSVRKESVVHLAKTDDSKQEGLRYSILFDFDNSKSVASYEKFLTANVAPLISDYSTVIIHGHTDEIGDEKYNETLSLERAAGVRQTLESALLKAGKKGVRFETFGFGENSYMSPFGNTLPEERFYNRTVIIDIIQAK